jgi:hypothetical protein
MRKFSLSLIVGLVLALGLRPVQANAQLALVLDSANLMQAIDTLYATYDQITQTIEQVKNSYEQLQKTITAYKKMDWKDLQKKAQEMDIRNPEKLRGQIDDAFYYVNKNMDLVNDIEDALTKKTISFGGKNYTYAGLFGIGSAASPGTTILDMPLNIWDYVEKTAQDVVAGYAGKLSYAQKEAIMAKHGLSPRNYAKVRLVEEGLGATLQSIIKLGNEDAISTRLIKSMDDEENLNNLSNMADESINANLQVLGKTLLNIREIGLNLETAIYRNAALTAHELTVKEYNERIAKEEAYMNEIQRKNQTQKYKAYADYH